MSKGKARLRKARKDMMRENAARARRKARQMAAYDQRRYDGNGQGDPLQA